MSISPIAHIEAELIIAQSRLEFEAWLTEHAINPDLSRSPDGNYTNYTADIFFTCWQTSFNSAFNQVRQLIKERTNP